MDESESVESVESSVEFDDGVDVDVVLEWV